MIDMDNKTEDISQAETAFTLRSIRPLLPQVPRLWPIVEGSVVEQQPEAQEQSALLGKIHDEPGETVAAMWQLCEQFHSRTGEWAEEVLLPSYLELLKLVAKNVVSICIEDEQGVHVIPFGVDRSIESDVFVVRGK